MEALRFRDLRFRYRVKLTNPQNYDIELHALGNIFLGYLSGVGRRETANVVEGGRYDSK